MSILNSVLNMYGAAELPLHDGRVPPHLLQFMKRLGKAIAMYIIDVFGPTELVKRLSNPLWFQAFNNVIGMDWDSSGSTTVVLYVLKSFANVFTFNDIGFAIIGGKGLDAKKCGMEIEYLSKHDLDVDRMKRISRLSAKIDSTALQDGYTLYIHSLIISSDNSWTVVQQGMNLSNRMARRYHIYSEKIVTIEQDPHSGIACNCKAKTILNLVDEKSSKTRKTILDFIKTKPKKILNELMIVNRILTKNNSLKQWLNHKTLENCRYCKHDKNIVELIKINPILYKPVTNISRIESALNKIVDKVVENFDELLLINNIGPEFIRALTLIADLIYGDTPSFKDPVTHVIDPFAYSFAHGGKDGVPFPVKFDVMRETIEFLEDAINNSKLDGYLKKRALENLYRYWKNIEKIYTHND